MKNEQQLDMRGHPCPEPVIETRKTLAAMSAGVLTVTVDNDGSAENVRRTATSLGLAVRVDRNGADFLVRITKVGDPSKEVPDALPFRASCEVNAPSFGTVVLVAGARFGEGDPELGDILIRAFIKTLKQIEPLPTHVIFVNSGVKLAAEGSVLIDDLRALADGGVEILACGTCLDYYHLKEELRIGRISNMFDIVDVLSKAERVVRP